MRSSAHTNHHKGRSRVRFKCALRVRATGRVVRPFAKIGHGDPGDSFISLPLVTLWGFHHSHSGIVIQRAAAVHLESISIGYRVCGARDRGTGKRQPTGREVDPISRIVLPEQAVLPAGKSTSNWVPLPDSCHSTTCPRHKQTSLGLGSPGRHWDRRRKWWDRRLGLPPPPR